MELFTRLAALLNASIPVDEEAKVYENAAAIENLLWVVYGVLETLSRRHYDMKAIVFTLVSFSVRWLAERYPDEAFDVLYTKLKTPPPHGGDLN